jgi:asparagine synthase (glutamine-hydrolysing)
MCGIAGHVGFERERTADESAVRAMCAIQAHRGPDSEGIWTEGSVALGHRRLSIIDVSDAGRQPMSSWDGEYVVTFNGEIYNYEELRQDLLAEGCRFRTQTDTEIILEGYRVWGEACIERFIGMWAFAICDRRRQRLFFSRDRFGIKPFYYSHDGRSFLFASEIKALLVVRPELRRPHEAYLARFLGQGLLDDGPETCFANVFHLPPAHSGSLSLREGQLFLYRYWDYEPEKSSATAAIDKDQVSALRQILESSILLHMRSDVPVGMCLSGGVDSSALACLITHRFGKPIHTFSGRYPDKDCDEGSYIDEVNRNAKTIPCPVFPEPQGNLMTDLQKITWHQDEPTAGPGLYTQYHVMKRARESVTVVLDGQGADEIFGGYLAYFGPYLQGLRAQGKIRGWFQMLQVLFDIQRHWGFAEMRRHLGRVVPLEPVSWLIQRFNGFFTPCASLLHPRLEEMLAREPVIRPEVQKFEDPLSNILYRQLAVDSLPALLHYEDRNSMAFSIEARVPYLDHRLVEYALSLPAHFKIRGTWTKWILREATADVLPRSIRFRRSKLGFATPMDRWLRSRAEHADVREILFSTRSAQREFVSPRAVNAIWTEHQQGKNHSWLLYRLITTELWFRQFVDCLEMNPAVAVTPSTRTSLGPGQPSAA